MSAQRSRHIANDTTWRPTRRPAAAAALIVCWLLALAGTAFADPPSHLVSAESGAGEAVVHHPEFTNIYLYEPVVAGETWNEHIAKVPGADTQATTTSLNAIVGALVASSFFDLLTQYNIEPLKFSGEQTTSKACAELATANGAKAGNGGVIQFTGLVEFLNCEHASAVSPQVNIFISPDLKVGGAVPPLFPEGQADICTLGHSGYHSGFPEFPDFTVIPTSTNCNGGIANVTSSFSHEMAETVSDPGGFGYIDETQTPRVAGSTDYEDGELADICQEKGLHPSLETNFEAGGFTELKLNPWWSNADAACVPQHIMNETLASLVGTKKLPDGTTGLIRMTGKAHKLLIPLADPPGVGRHFLQAVELLVKTGGDNLNGGNELNDGASLGMTFNTNTAKELKVPVEHVNQGQEWANGSLHALLVRIPPGRTLEELKTMTLTTAFNGNDNWDVEDVTVEAAVPCPHGGGVGTTCTETAEPPECKLIAEASGGPPKSIQPAPLVDKKASKTKEVAELTEANRSFSKKVKVDPKFEKLVVSGLQLSITTGGDNLGGGSQPSSNANVVITLTNGSKRKFNDINQGMQWNNNSTSQTFEIPASAFPPKMTLGDIKEFAITTNFSGSEKWDIKEVELDASVACELGVEPLPHPVEVTSVNEEGSAELPDGSKGLKRLTGEVHSWSAAVMPDPPNENKVVTDLELIVKTGGDDLRGGNTRTDNADAHVRFGSHEVVFDNINASEKWNNESTNEVDLYQLNTIPPGTTAGLPPGTKLGELKNLEISTEFTGGTEGDNWDIKDVKLVASVE